MEGAMIPKPLYVQNEDGEALPLGLNTVADKEEDIQSMTGCYEGQQIYCKDTKTSMVVEAVNEFGTPTKTAQTCPLVDLGNLPEGYTFDQTKPVFVFRGIGDDVTVVMPSGMVDVMFYRIYRFVGHPGDDNPGYDYAVIDLANTKTFIGWVCPDHKQLFAPDHKTEVETFNGINFDDMYHNIKVCFNETYSDVVALQQSNQELSDRISALEAQLAALQA